MKRKYLILAIAIIVILGIVFCCSGFLNRNNKLDSENNTSDTLTEEAPTHSDNSDNKDEPSLKLFRNLYNNEDIIASIVIPAIDLNELVVKGSDNDFYLDHNIQKNKDINGAIFMDYRTRDINTSPQINIYGHNSDSQDIPFGKLVQYQNEDFFYKHLDLTLKTDEGNYSYRIFAVSLEPKNYDEHMIISYEGEDFVKHVKKMREDALFDTKEEVTQSDQIIVLQTCLFRPKQFLILYAKKVG